MTRVLTALIACVLFVTGAARAETDEYELIKRLSAEVWDKYRSKTRNQGETRSRLLALGRTVGRHNLGGELVCTAGAVPDVIIDGRSVFYGEFYFTNSRSEKPHSIGVGVQIALSAKRGVDRGYAIRAVHVHDFSPAGGATGEPEFRIYYRDLALEPGPWEETPSLRTLAGTWKIEGLGEYAQPTSDPMAAPWIRMVYLLSRMNAQMFMRPCIPPDRADYSHQ